MRVLTVVLVLLATLWSAAWLAGARLVERAAETWLAERTAEGFVADHEKLSVTGFPLALALRIETLRLGDPRAGHLWQIPRAEIAVQAARPSTLHARLQGRQQLVVAGVPMALDPETFEARLRIGGRALDLREAVLTATGLRVEVEGQGTAATAERLDAAVRTEPGAAERADVALTVTTLAPGAGPVPAVERLDFLGTIVLDAPLDRRAAERPPHPTAVIVEAATLDWAGAQGRTEGRIDIGADGLPEGRLDIEVTGWRRVLDLAVALGAFGPDTLPALERMLGVVEAAGRRPGAVTLPLILVDGWMRLGPLPLGPAPRIARR